MSITIHAGTEELDISNRNFGTLWSALGQEFDYCGSIEADRLEKALNRLDPRLVERQEEREFNYISFGIYPGQIERYIQRLRAIIKEAKEKDRSIYWG